MKSKTLAFAALVLVTLFMLIDATVPYAALAGATWTNTGRRVSSYSIQSLAYDSAHNLLYAGCYDFSTHTNKGVWRYDGTTWTDTGGEGSKNTNDALTYDSVHNLLYAGGAGGVWKYDGTTWTDTGQELSWYSICSLAYDSVHNLLYAGTVTGGIWKYDGKTWTDTGGEFSSLYIYSLTYDSVHNLLYAGTSGFGVFRYDGSTWTDIGGGVSDYDVYDLACDSGQSLLYAGCGNPEIRVWVGEPGGPRPLVTRTSQTYGGKGVWKYDGVSWTDSGGGLSSHYVYSLAYDSTHNVLYAGTGKNGVWKYDGTNWTNTGGDVFDYGVNALAYDSGQNMLFAGVGSYGVWKYNGASPPNFNSYIVLQNPNAQTANVTLTYMMEEGETKKEDITLGPTSRKTLSLNDSVGAGKSFSTMVSSNISIIAERPMYFNYNGAWTGGHDVVGALAPDTTWYFAEGSCRPNFDPYICVQNLDTEEALVKITYMKGDGTTATQNVTVPKNSRFTVTVKDTLGEGDDAAHDFSAKVECTSGQEIIAERPMYFNYNGVWTGGHDVIGAVAPQSTFYFAEGTCRPNFDPYLCIQNPGGTDAEVTITYMKGDGTTATDTVTVPKNSRKTVQPRDKLGTGDDPAHDFSCKVECTNHQGIIAERPTYFNYNGLWTGGQDVVGAVAPQSTFYFAEGTCRPNFDPWICIQNPGSADAAVTLTYMKGDGTTATDQVTVPKNSRSTVSPRDKLGTGDDAAHDFSCKVECTNHQGIIAERPTYFNYNGVWTGGHDVVGALAPEATWYFAEGYTGW